jgi:hypothetical protein
MMRRGMPLWFIYSTISMLIWAIWSLLSPIASRDLSGAMVQLLSSVGLVPFALVLLLSRNLKKGTRPGKGLLLGKRLVNRLVPMSASR